jgi:hypothetical protein
MNKSVHKSGMHIGFAAASDLFKTEGGDEQILFKIRN